MSDAIDRTPPQDREAEAAVLGSILIDNDCLDDVLGLVVESDFYRRGHSVIFQAMVAIYDSRHALDMVTLREELERRGTLEDAGGIEYLTQLADAVPSAANAVEYTEIVREKAARREIIRLGAQLLRIAYESSTKGAEDLFDEAGRVVFGAIDGRARVSDLVPVSILAAQVLRAVQVRRTGTIDTGVVPTGYFDIDRLLPGGGFRPGQMIILAGMPSHGKTTLAENILYNVAGAGISTLLFSLEVRGIDTAEHMLIRSARMDGDLIQDGTLNDEQYEQLDEISKRDIWSRMHVWSGAAITPLRIRALSRQAVNRHGVGLIVVDYLQLVNPSSPQRTREREIGSISTALKELARELQVPLVAVAQLSRSAAHSPDGRPKLHHLRDSGQLEQDADVVIFIHRPAKDTEGGDRTAAVIDVAKNREGATGVSTFHFFGAQRRLEQRTGEGIPF